MKTKLFTLLAILSIAFFSSCSKDDDITISQSDIVGTWNVYSAIENGVSTDIPDGYIYAKMYSDNSYYMYFINYGYSGTYSVSGNTVTGVSGSVTEYFVFTEFDGSSAAISYSNTTGDKYTFYATKN